MHLDASDAKFRTICGGGEAQTLGGGGGGGARAPLPPPPPPSRAMGLETGAQAPLNTLNTLLIPAAVEGGGRLSGHPQEQCA